MVCMVTANMEESLILGDWGEGVWMCHVAHINDLSDLVVLSNGLTVFSKNFKQLWRFIR